MTDEQIIKPLECCVAQEDCEEVSCEICFYERVYDCKKEMLQNTLNFINRQKKAMNKIKNDLKYYLDINEKNGIVYIPSFAIKNLINEVTEK